MIPLLYKDRRQEGDTVLRQCQLVQLHLLHVFDRVCKENGLQYLLLGGTLLGAMRHNGFIPWDDDLDVGMLRKDYEKFLKLAPAALPKDVFLHKPSDTPRTAIPFAKLRDAYSFYGNQRRDLAIADMNGIYIDVFPYDDMPAIGRPLQQWLSKVCASTWARTKYYHRCGRSICLDILHALGGLFFKFLHGLTRILIWVLNRIFPSRDYYLCLESPFVIQCPKECMFPAKEHVFEDGVFPIPANADRILSEHYGDWHWIPPVEKRPRHAMVIDPFHSASDRQMEYPHSIAGC